MMDANKNVFKTAWRVVEYPRQLLAKFVTRMIEDQQQEYRRKKCSKNSFML
ncbi:hypothetical protein FD35_GL001718 [Furfurilactobacillus rossiae DSM 15814]|uniref:Uncharacterized protein n=1 Tax=Furfurilactobacillus rossiae DSM 15814 TaxID=1114972 RepID=A0A0R1RI06_9LACO|nr:hypothetical protein FD35_GL001718 [Furfurilactobacillus rossiae DSM 15814]